jgi:hypothetical protein
MYLLKGLFCLILALSIIVAGGMKQAFAGEDPGDLFNYSFDRVGIDYRWGDEGLRGIGFNLGFPF